MYLTKTSLVSKDNHHCTWRQPPSFLTTTTVVPDDNLRYTCTWRQPPLYLYLLTTITVIHIFWRHVPDDNHCCICTWRKPPSSLRITTVVPGDNHRCISTIVYVPGENLPCFCRQPSFYLIVMPQKSRHSKLSWPTDQSMLPFWNLKRLPTKGYICYPRASLVN